LIKELHHRFFGHLSEEEPTLLATGGLPARKRARVEQHIATCDRCRARVDCCRDVFLQVVEYHAYCAEGDQLAICERRARLVGQLNQMSHHLQDIQTVRIATGKTGMGRLFSMSMSSVLVTGLLLVLGTVTGIFFLTQQARPAVTSNALLVRAEEWDPIARNHGMPGIVRQTVRITAGKQSVNRTLYRDAQGKRRPRTERLAAEENELKRRLAEANVDWDAPLSATGYKDWHDEQRVREESIERSAGSLLILTTTTPEGAVAGESLTVRDTDFHPVSRTVSFRDSETVEIAELDYAVLPWSPMDDGLFQPEGGLRSDGPAPMQPTLAQAPPAPLNEGQLAEVELSARLMLNRLHADTGEQIEIARDPHGIQVRGITDTEERKHELAAQLEMLPHVTAVISSMEEMKARAAQPHEISTVKVIEMQTGKTPLEAYYLAHGRNIAPLGSYSQRLFNFAFAIHLESREIDDLERRFPGGEGISLVASATLSELLLTHKRKLLEALQSEEALIAEAQIQGAVSRPDTTERLHNSLLAALAERNLELAREFALGKESVGRSAETIASELMVSIDELTRRAHEIRASSQDSTNVDNRK